MVWGLESAYNWDINVQHGWWGVFYQNGRSPAVRLCCITSPPAGRRVKLIRSALCESPAFINLSYLCFPKERGSFSEEHDKNSCTIGSEIYLDVSYLHYLDDAHLGISSCIRACQVWSAQYDGEDPPLRSTSPASWRSPGSRADRPRWRSREFHSRRALESVRRRRVPSRTPPTRRSWSGTTVTTCVRWRGQKLRWRVNLHSCLCPSPRGTSRRWGGRPSCWWTAPTSRRTSSRTMSWFTISSPRKTPEMSSVGSASPRGQNPRTSNRARRESP